jgi:DNA repair photolyase
LKEAKRQGIKVYGFISPVLPGITNLEELFKELRFCDYVWVELLNTKPYILERLMPVIRENFPKALKDFELAIENPDEYYDAIKKESRELEKQYGLKVKEIVRHQ